jgi:hypothetical protein
VIEVAAIKSKFSKTAHEPQKPFGHSITVDKWQTKKSQAEPVTATAVQTTKYQFEPKITVNKSK